MDNPPAHAQRPYRRFVLSLVILTVLCLGMGGYVFQAFRAGRIAQERYQRLISPPYINQFNCSILGCGALLRTWTECPWYGRRPEKWDSDWKHYGWIPRRTYYELLKLMTQKDLGDSPAAWDVYFRAHPNQIWDGRMLRMEDASQSLPDVWEAP